ncbi:MAG: hypothetical protein JO257_37150 [Deltaproteobacteria bacterium]|nr:hypothetical protein [Deltaproteobacteria bacterium]
MTKILVAILIALSVPAFAGPSKDECLDAHSRGQDAKEQGKISLARKLFLTCAQNSCPNLVQGDCARYADELGRMQPSISFVARDTSGADLPDTTVYVDDVLIVTRLDDGKPHEIDPGKHTVKFTNAGRDRMVTVVIGAGEQGRTVSAQFEGPKEVAPPKPNLTLQADSPVAAAPPKHVAPKTTHPTGAKLMIYGGVAMAAGGIGLGLFETSRVPSNCSVSTHQCAAPPGDPSITAAKSAMQTANIGWMVGAVGVAAVAGGITWYVTGSKTEKEHLAVAPWASSTAGGLAIGGSL